MEESEKINRRELINSSALAGLALAFGMLGMDNPVKGQIRQLDQTKQLDKTETINIPPRKQFIEQEASPQKYKLMDFQNLLEQIKGKNSDTFQMESIVGNKIKSLNLIPAIDSDCPQKLNEIEHFNPNNIEDLLDQAADLLDRGLKDRTEWDNLSIRLFYLELEINQFIELDNIHQEEISKGFYDQLLNEKLSQLNIEKLNKEMFEQISSVFSDMFTKMWDEQKINSILNEKGTLALIGVGGTDPHDIPHQAGILAYNHTVYVEQFEMAIQKVYAFAQNQGLLNSEGQSNLKEKLLKKQVNWEEIDRDFRLMRTDVDRKYEYIKLLAFKAEDGVLNLRKRMEPLKTRFENDFNEARLRLEAASSGLNTIFGYKKTLPKFEGQIDYFDRSVLWCRDAINWLISTSQMDQSFVTTISLKQLFTTKKNISFESVFNQGNLKFNIDEATFFKEYYNVRLKGASIFVQLSEKKKSKKNYSINDYQGIIQCEINIPVYSYYRYSEGITKDVDQSYIPTVKLNRIASRNFIRQPDIVGTTLFNNLSPIGEWNLFFPQIINENILDKVNLNDIQLDLFITARRLR